MIIDMHAHILTEEMIRLMQGVSKTYAPFLTTTDTPYPSGLTTSSQGFTLTFPSRPSTTTWPEGGHNVALGPFAASRATLFVSSGHNVAVSLGESSRATLFVSR